jgi:ankyrin repeat protein
MQAVDTTSLSSLLVGEYSGGIALFPLNDIQSQKTNHFYEKPLEKQDQDPVEGSTGPSLSIETSCSRPGPNIGLQSAEEMTANSGNYSSMFDWSLPSPNILSMDSDLTFLQSPAIPTLSISDSSSFNGPYVSVNSSESNGNNLESLQLATKSALEKVDRLVTESASLGDNLDTESLLPTRGRPSRESVLTMTSLNRRLSAKYTPSYLDDVMSLLEHHTISGSSTRNSEISSRRSSKSFLRQSEIRRGLTAMDEQPVLPVKVKPPVVLPGVFHTYCVAQINQNSLERCRHDGLLCEHTSPDTLRFFVSYLDSGKILYSRLEHRRINDVDRFGNSILHVAASLKAPVKYLIKLIKLKANINATNAAKETFLHLVVAPTQADDICLLLEILSRNSFNFGRHDQHGQTSLHVLTRPWLPRDYLIKVIRKVHSLGFVLPTSRDNLGFTLLNQMKHVGTHALGFDPDEDMAYRLSLGLTCHTQGYVVRPYDNKTVESSIVQRKHHHGKDEAQDFTHAMEDFQLKYHTDLLATIVTAGDKPWFEDSKGRNSLHCLAEVAIDVPKRNNPSPHTQLPENEICGDRNILRENYLEGLLAAGVNPNNYDKAGNTPLMAFIIHTRVEEDDDTTLRILNRLLDAKAGIHRRNRQGETALHLAIKLGRRAATKFLLQKGAHVYARNKKGMGILEVGLEACKKLGHDEALYSQILLSMSLVMSAGAVSSPTIVLEWSSWPKRISDVTNTMNL